MFEDIKNRLTDKLNISNLNSFLITVIGLGVSLIVYLVRLSKEKDTNSLNGICRGCFLYFLFITINLMDAHIISFLFYLIIKITIGNIYKFIVYSIYFWSAGILFKIGLNIFLFVILSVIYISIVYYVLAPNSPIILFLGMTLSFIWEMIEEDSNSQKESTNKGIFDSGELIDAYIEDQKNADIKKTADELEKIRYELSKK